MNQADLFKEIIATYRKHGWRLERVLVRPEISAEVKAQIQASGDSPHIGEAPVDAMWFARTSNGGREAWELRLVAESPYALLETFEADETEEAREEVRREMEMRLRNHVAPA
ncbi:MAG: hypothetical protein ABLT11_10915 [Candidatus Acidiferrum sp.]